MPVPAALVRASFTHDKRADKVRMKLHLNTEAIGIVNRKVEVSGNILTGLKVVHNSHGRMVSTFGRKGDQKGFISFSHPGLFLGFEPNGVTEVPIPLETIVSDKHLETRPMSREDIEKHLLPVKALRASTQKKPQAHQRLPAIITPSGIMPEDERKLANAILNINEAVKRAGLLLTLRDGLLEAALPVKWRKLGS